MKEKPQIVDRIQGQAREEAVACLASLHVAASELEKAHREIHHAIAEYSGALVIPLPGAADLIESAAERATAVYARMREVFK